MSKCYMFYAEYFATGEGVTRYYYIEKTSLSSFVQTLSDWSKTDDMVKYMFEERYFSIWDLTNTEDFEAMEKSNIPTFIKDKAHLVKNSGYGIFRLKEHYNFS